MQGSSLYNTSYVTLALALSHGCAAGAVRPAQGGLDCGWTFEAGLGATGIMLFCLLALTHLPILQGALEIEFGSGFVSCIDVGGSGAAIARALQGLPHLQDLGITKAQVSIADISQKK